MAGGQVVEAARLDVCCPALWQAAFDGPRLRAALAGSTGQVEVTFVAHLANGSTLTGADTVTLEASSLSTGRPRHRE